MANQTLDLVQPAERLGDGWSMDHRLLQGDEKVEGSLQCYLQLIEQ